MSVDKLLVHEPELALSVVSESVVGIDGPNAEPYILPLSGFDRLVQGYPVTVLFVYRNPSSSAAAAAAVFSTIKSALPKALDQFFPFAGTIARYSTNGEVICNNTGARLLEASANFSLSRLCFYDLDRTTKDTLLPASPDHLLNIQVTRYTCGGFSVSWTFDHQIADAYGFSRLVASLCDVARTGHPSPAPVDHERSFLLRPRSPPAFGTLVDRTFTALTDGELLDLPQTGVTSRHLYIAEGSTLEQLRANASSGSSPKRTRTEALAAYIWKVMARTIEDESGGASCRLGVIVDGRTRTGEDMSSFVGNMLSLAVREESVRDLQERSLAEVAACVSAAIREVANEDHFLDVVDWVECHGQGKVAAGVAFGHGVPAIVVNSTHHIPTMSADFGFGQPSLSVMLPTLGWYGPGYVTMAATGRSDGSLFVSLFVRPELAAALESDSEYILRPITLDHLQLS